MAVSIVDQNLLFTETVSNIPPKFIDVNRPHITGGHAKLFRYDTAAEKALISLGAYASNANTTYDYPNFPEGSIVDQDYVKVYVDNMRLRYYSRAAGAGSTIERVADYKNRVKANGLVFKTANGSNRSGVFYDRDVAIGDIVYLEKSDASVNFTTEVVGFVPEVVAGAIGSASVVTGNKGQSAVTVSASLTSGSDNGVVVTANDSAYSPFYDGFVSEVYTVKVVTGGAYETAVLSVTSASGLDNVASVTTGKSGTPLKIGTRGLTLTFTGGSFLAGTTWTVTVQKYYGAIASSTSSGTYTGTKDLTYIVTVTQGGWAGSSEKLPEVASLPAVTGATTSGGSIPAGSYFVGYTYLSPGGETAVKVTSSAVAVDGSQKIRITLPALNVTPAGATAFNIYVGSIGGANTTLKLFKSRVALGTSTYDVDFSSSTLTTSAFDGLPFASATAAPTTNTATIPVCLVTAVDTTGVDSSGPTVVPTNRVVSVGSFGASITLGTTAGNASVYSGNPYCAGDKFTFTCTAATDGAVQTIVLKDNMPDALTGDMATKLFIQKNAVLPKYKLESPPSVNFSTTGSTVTVNSNATAFDSTWTNGGSAMALPVVSGTMYLEYRAWLPTYAGALFSISSRTDLADVLGPEDPDNPLCYAVGKALLNSFDGFAVYFTAVEDPDVEAYWDDVLETIEKTDDIYCLVPLTNSESIIDKYIAYATEHSTAEFGMPRKVLATLPMASKKVIVDSTLTSNSLTALGILVDNPAVTGTQYSLLQCTTGNAKFQTNGVTSGDTVRYLYSVDSYGDEVYSEFTVASVVNEDELVVQDPNGSAVNTPQKFEIYRTLSRSDVADEMVDYVTAKKNSRFIPVIPETLADGDVKVPGYFGCAALAGLIGAVAPHQSIRYVGLNGFTGVGVTLNSGQYNTAENAGCTSLAAQDGVVYVRKARTSDNTSTDTLEEASQRISDTVTNSIMKLARNLYGTTNITSGTSSDGAVAALSTGVISIFSELSSAVIPRLGGVILGGTVDLVRPSTVLPDSLVIQTTITKPYALGQATLVLVVGS